jgi:peptidoglycan/LPS O-acetylase OafA/YrhL
MPGFERCARGVPPVPRLAFLDGLRGLAVLYVLLSPLRIMAASTFLGRSSDPSPRHRPRSRLEAVGRPTTLDASAS